MKLRPPAKNVFRAFAALLAVTVILTGCLSAQQQEGTDLLNRDRSAYSLKALKNHGHLQSKAQAWAEKLARDGKLSHSNLASGAPSCWRGLGENVGRGSSIAEIERAYMASSGHRANILNRTYDWVGLGVATKGGRVYTVQVFMDGC